MKEKVTSQHSSKDLTLSYDNVLNYLHVSLLDPSGLVDLVDSFQPVLLPEHTN